MSSPSLTAKGRRSTWRRTMVLSTQVGDVERATTRWAIQWRGSASTSSASSSSSAPGRGRPDHQPLAARAVDPLEDEVAAAGQRVLADAVVHQVHGLDVVQDRILAQVVADHGRHVGVDELVVGHPVAHPVGDRDPPRPRRVDDAGAAHQRLGPELQRVEVLVVDAPVDHVDRHLALGGAEEDVGAVAHEVAALHQVHAHEARQQRVLVEGRVVHARREHDDRRILHRGRRGAAQRVDQAGRVVGDHLDRLAPEQLGQHPRHGGAVGQHVAHARRAAQVVLEHPELAVLVADRRRSRRRGCARRWGASSRRPPARSPASS